MFPGVSTLNQIERVLRATGMPSQEEIDSMNSPHCTKIFATIPPTKKVNLESSFPTATEDAIDLMIKLLKFNPSDRLTVEEALEHPYVAQFHDIDSEPVCKKIISISIDDNKKFSIKEYRLKIYTDIHRRKKELRKRKMLQEQAYLKKKKAAMGYSTQYGSSGYSRKEASGTYSKKESSGYSKKETSSYHKKESRSSYSKKETASGYGRKEGSIGRRTRPATTHGKGHGTYYGSTKTAAEREKQYYSHSKTYKM